MLSHKHYFSVVVTDTVDRTEVHTRRPSRTEGQEAHRLAPPLNPFCVSREPATKLLSQKSGERTGLR